MNSNDPRSSDFSYKKYSLEQLDNWVNDAVNCEDLTPQDIYETILKCVDESVEYHKKYYTKSVELFSLLKGPVEIDTSLNDIDPTIYIDASKKSGVSSATQKDWSDFWEETYYPEEHQQYTSGAERYPAAYVYTDEEINAMCEHAATENDKDKCREYNLREVEYYNKRAQLDIQEVNKQIEIAKKIDSGEVKVESRNVKTYDEMIAEGWQMTDDGFWIKETDKGISSVSA